MPSKESLVEAEQLIYDQIEALGLELEAVKAELEKHRTASLNYLRADYMSTHAITKTIICTLLGHPDKYPPGYEPKFTTGGCPCGFRPGKPA